MTDEAVGVPVDEDDPWVAAKKEMYPAASLARIAANAKFTVATVSVVGTALTALGLVTAASVNTDKVARILAIVAAGIALLAVLSALSYLAVRLEKRNPENYVEVRRWYDRQFNRAWLVVAASWLLIAALLVASVAGLVAAWSTGRSDPPVLNLAVTSATDKNTVVATASVSGEHSGDVVAMQLTDQTNRTLVTSKATVDTSGAAKLTATVDDSSRSGKYRLTVSVAGRERASLEIP